MSYKEVLDGSRITISISESEKMAGLGLSAAHLIDAMCEAARHMLALGATITYGGDLRAHGFTKILYELVSRYRKDSDDQKAIASVVSLLAWPIFINSDFNELLKLSTELEGTAEIKVISEKSKVLSLEEAAREVPSPYCDWSSALTTMRKVMTDDSSARIVLGGKTEKFLGSMPGVAEEALMSLRAQKPLYLLGGFGGCAREILDLMDVENLFGKSAPIWPSADEFKKYRFDDFHNGLNGQENTALAITPHIDQAIILIIRGLMNLKHNLPTN